MATQNLYIPSSTDAYNSPYGDIRLKLYYETSGATVSETFDAPFEFASNLTYEFRQIPDSGKVQLSSVKIRFFNKDNIFETHASGSIWDHADDVHEIFCDIILDGSIKWSGVVDYINMTKSRFYVDGTLKYKYIEIPFVDKLRVLERYSLADAGISDGDYIANVFFLLQSQAGLSGVDSTYVGFTFTEVNGTTYSLTGRTGTPPGLKLEVLDTSENCMELLKKIARGFGLVFFNYSNALVIQARNNGSFTALDAAADDLPIKKIEKRYPLTYLAVKATQDWTKLYDYTPGGTSPNLNLRQDTRRFETGTVNPNTSQNMVLDVTEILSRIYVDAPSSGDSRVGQTFPNTITEPSDRPGELKIVPDTAKDYSALDVESGMLVVYNYGTGADGVWSVLTRWTDGTGHIYMLAFNHTAAFVIKNKFFQVVRHSISGVPEYARLYKIYGCLETLCEVLGEGLLGTQSMEYKTRDFIHPYSNFSYDSVNYFLGKVQYNFRDGVTTAEGDALAGTPTITAPETSGTPSGATPAIDDGANKVTASEAATHFADETQHIKKNYDGTSYMELVDTEGNARYVYVKIDRGRRLLAIDDAPPEPQSTL